MILSKYMQSYLSRSEMRLISFAKICAYAYIGKDCGVWYSHAQLLMWLNAIQQIAK